MLQHLCICNSYALCRLQCTVQREHARNGSPRKTAALIIDGQNNHDWKTTTPLLQESA